MFVVSAAVPAAAAASIIVKPANNLGLVGYWSFNEGVGGSAGDATNNASTSTITGAVWTSGRLGNALSFNGIDNSVAITGKGLPTGTGAYSVSTWVFMTDYSGVRYIAEWGNLGDTGNPTLLNFGGNWRWSCFACSSWIDVNNTSDLNKWTHLVGVYDGSNILLYRNGELIGGPTSITGSNPTTQFGYFGRRIGNSSDAFAGKIDEARVYNRALSAGEVAALYKSGAAAIGASQAKLQNGSSLTRGLIGHWTFDGADVSDKVYDRSGQGNNGYYVGAATTTAKAGGQVGQALNFNGSNTSVNVPNNASLQITNAITISAWINGANNWTHPTEANYILAKRDLTSFELEEYSLGVTTSGYLQFKFYNELTFQLQDNTTPLSIGQWYFVAATYDLTRIRLYVNGVEVYSGAQTGAMFSNNNTLSIGRVVRDNNSSFGEFQGKIDDVRLYNRVLSANEIKQLYNLGNGTQGASATKLQNGSSIASGLVGHWTFDGPDMTDKVYDKSEQGNHGYFKNGATSTMKVSGKMGQGVRFGGVNNVVEAGNTGLQLSSGGFSNSAWVYITSTSEQMILFHGLGCSTWGSWMLSVGGNENNSIPNKFTFGFGTSSASGATNLVQSSANATTGQWVHVVGTYDGSSSLRLYLNGVLDATLSTSGNPWASTNNVYIGGDAGCSGRFNVSGSIDDARVYNRILSASEVKQLYNLGR